MKANRKQNAVKLTASKIPVGTHVMVQDVTKYGKQCLHQVVTAKLRDSGEFSDCVQNVGGKVTKKILHSVKRPRN